MQQAPSRPATKALALRQRGFTLAELAVGLAVLGMLTLGGMALLDRARQQADTANASINPSVKAEVALVAYAQAQMMFPAPQGAHASSTPGYQEGTVPWGTLGLPDAGAVRYVVDERLLAPTSTTAYNPNKIQEAYGAPGSPSAWLTGLPRPARPDFCQRLLHLAPTSTGFNQGPGVAFLTAEPTDANYSQAHGRGIGELAAGLGCVEMIAAMDGHALAHYATQDHLRMAEIRREIDQTLLWDAYRSMVQAIVRQVRWGNKTYLSVTSFITDITKILTSNATGAATAAATAAIDANAAALFIYGDALNAYWIVQIAQGIEARTKALAASDAYIKRVQDEQEGLRADLLKYFTTI